jgi:hypothetical protein
MTLGKLSSVRPIVTERRTLHTTGEKTMKRLLINLGLVLLVAALLPTLSFGSDPNNGVIPRNVTAYGLSYSDWSARWWQWATSMSLDKHPLANTAGCNRGQFGPVWFLGGNFSSTSGGTRNCNLPAGKALFFPIVNVDCSNLETGDFYGATASDRRACARGIIDHVTDLAVEIDGVSLKNLTTYRATSPNIVFAVAPLPNVLGVVAGSGELVADGYYLLLAPLSSGHHTIHFQGTFSQWGVTIGETYSITVP